MKKYLIPESGSFYKANLHCHSTYSDGEYSPEELKKMYMAQGYSAIAFTEHNLMIPHPELNDENFVALMGYELHFQDEDFAPGADKMYVKSHRTTCGFNFISPKPDQTLQPCYHRTMYPHPDNPVGMNRWRPLINYDHNAPDFMHYHEKDHINNAIKKHQDLGFFCVLNHPGFNQEKYEEYTGYEGLDAVEITNFSGITYGKLDYCEKEYDDLLRTGHRICCIATDDNHNHERSHPERRMDSFGGFTMIKAPKLDYVELVKALKAGNCYASQGPLIHELYIADGKVHIKCSCAREIRMNTGCRRAEIKWATNGVPVTEAVFTVQPTDDYIRITVTDGNGLHANTRAYFVDELLD